MTNGPLGREAWPLNDCLGTHSEYKGRRTLNAPERSRDQHQNLIKTSTFRMGFQLSKINFVLPNSILDGCRTKRGKKN